MFIKIEKLKVNESRVECFFKMSEQMKKFFQGDMMYIDYGENISNVPKSILVIPFIANILPIIWLTNSSLWVEEIDEEYYYSTFRIRNAYREMYKNINFDGSLIAAKILKNNYSAENEALQLFSGGIDAITTNIRIKEKEPFLIYIHGWNENEKYDSVFDSEKKLVLEYSKTNEMPIKFVKSNFANFTNLEFIDKRFKKKLKDSWWHGIQHGGAFITHAIPIAYKYKIEKIYIASSNYLNGERVTCSSDPVIDIEYRYASGKVVHDGFELNRQDKIGIVAKDINKSNEKTYLKVCSFKEKNCCNCEKCFRTIIALVAEGFSVADLRYSGFLVPDNLALYYENLMEKNIQFFGVEFEEKIYWKDTKKRIIENKKNIIEIDFVEWFLSYNFSEKRKKAILKYRIKNCIPIIKRKVFKSKL